MVLQTTLLIVLCFVAACLSLNVTLQGEIKYEETLNFTIPASNLYDVAQFTLHSTESVTVCIQEKYSPPGVPHFSNETCTFFYNLTSGDHTFEVDLRNILYQVGIYFASSAITATNVTNVSVSVTGNTCQPGHYYDSEQHSCSKSNPLPFGSTIINVTEGLTNTQFFEVNAPEVLGYISVNVEKLEENGFTIAPAIIRLRYNAAPSALNYDADNVAGPAKIISPRPGLWVVSFETQDAGHYRIVVDWKICTDEFAGENCNLPVEPAQSNMTLVAYPNEWRYWRFVVHEYLELNVSLTTLDHNELPHLLVLQGNIPTFQNAIIMNCNQDSCNVVNSIHVAATSGGPEVWFIGVTASVIHGNTSYGIWFNTTCAPECETDNHGSCEDDGTCTCQMDYTGVDCAISNGMGAQIIVLIIIAALIVASAVIGFVAWAYMRRKRVNYELVS